MFLNEQLHVLVALKLEVSVLLFKPLFLVIRLEMICFYLTVLTSERRKYIHPLFAKVLRFLFVLKSKSRNENVVL